MSGEELWTQSTLVDNVSWQNQISILNFADKIFTFIYLHKKASVDLRLIIESQLIPRLPRDCYCVINCCNQRFSTTFGDKERTVSSYKRPQPLEEIRFSEYLRQELTEGLPLLRTISAKEEALVMQFDMTQTFSDFNN